MPYDLWLEMSSPDDQFEPLGRADAAGQAESGSAPSPAEQAEEPPQRPHVVLICDGEAWGRLGTIIHRLLVGLIDEAARVSLLCDHDCPVDLALPGLQATYRLPKANALDVFRRGHRFAALAEVFRKTGVCCLHAVSLGTLKTALAARRVLNLPLLVTADAKEPARLKMLARNLGEGCLAAAMSEPIRESLLSRARDPAAAAKFVQLIRPGIHAQERQQAPFEPGVPVSALVIEPLEKGSGLEAVVRALGRLTRSEFNVMLFFLGTGPIESALRKLASNLNIQQRVTFTGRFRRWNAALPAADMVIVPRPHKRIHIYPLQAMASATLVVAASGHCYDAIIDGKTAVEFQPGNDQDLAEKLIGLLREPHHTRSLAYAGQEYLRQAHSVSQMASAIAALYQRLAGTRQT